MYLRRVKKTVTPAEAARLLAIVTYTFLENNGQCIEDLADFTLEELIATAYQVEQDNLHTYMAIKGPAN